MAETPEPPDFSVTAHSSAGATVIAVAGEIDLTTSGELGAAVREHLAQGPVLLDLSGVSFLDSSGVHVIDSLVREAASNDQDLTISPELQDSVRNLLEITNMLDELPFAR